MATSVPEDSIMSENQAPPPIPAEEPKYGGFTRFEIELEVSFAPWLSSIFAVLLSPTPSLSL
jgi:hypothetical protein